MEIRINRLKLKNFKGIRKLDESFDGNNAGIYGANALGKSSCFDAFLWLLFGKDSHGRADFDIKTVDADGNVLHGLDHEVEFELEVSGKTLTLKKVYREKWTKKRGSSTQEFTGHTTDHFIDSVPVSKSEYTAKINSLIDEETFKLLTNPKHFNEQLKWEKRREILLSVCGDVSDSDVIASSDELSTLPEILGDRSLDDHKKVIAAERKRINKELEKLPVRIDEVTQGMPDVSEIVPEKIKSEIEKHKGKKADAEAEKSRLENGGQAAELKKHLAEVEGEIQAKKNAHQKEVDRLIKAEKAKLPEIEKKLEAHNRTIRNAQIDIDANNADILKLEKAVADLRNKWHSVNTLEATGDPICPTCRQALPEDQAEAAREKFNSEKAADLKQIQIEGKEKADRIEKDKTEIASLKKQINDALAEVAALTEQQEKIEARIESLQGEEIYVEDLENKKADLEAQIQKLDTGDNTDAIEKAAAKIVYCDEQIEALQLSLSKIDQKAAAETRIKELSAEEKKLAKEYERLESELYLAEQFTRAKVNILEEKINGKFSLVKWKLFDEQVNGGLSETCVCMVNGVPYPSVNSAAKIQAGIDIISTLSQHYGFIAPLWIDNREGIVELPNIENQTISLIVSADHKKLTIETEKQSKAA